jgi:hypothetical protein
MLAMIFKTFAMGRCFMEFNDLERILKQVIAQFYRNDSSLLADRAPDSAHECSIAHRLAVYLETACPVWNIDCEYNRIGQNHNIKQNTEGKKIRPDVIVHHRDKLEIEHNLLAIEVKKAASDHDSKDIGKLQDLTAKPKGKRRVQYQYGLALSFVPNLSLRWFHEGEELP